MSVAFLAGMVASALIRDPAPGRSRPEIHGDEPIDRASALELAPLPDGSMKGALLRTYANFSQDRILSVGAGCVFYILLSLFPALASLVSLYGLFADPAALSDHVSFLSNIVPASALSLVTDELRRIVDHGATKLSFALVFSVGLSLWSANAGLKALMDALNVAYEEKERRSFLLLNATSLFFTLLSLLLVGATIGLIVILPAALQWMGLGSYQNSVLSLIRYPVLAAGALLALAVLYRFGPDRARPKWKWVTWGSVFATTCWILTSVAFSWYAANFASYDKTYGALGAVVGLLMWLWISVTIVLIGAEFNFEIEKRAKRLGVQTEAAPPPGRVEPAF
jgi:membrane protein